MKILLVEPDYRSTFPPLGLLRLSSFFKEKGIIPKFIRGMDKEILAEKWDIVFISSLFTYELPRTVKTINFYSSCVNDPSEDIIVGGVGATLLPDYIRDNSKCKVIVGSLDKPNILGLHEPPISNFMPDYALLDDVEKQYRPDDAYFTRVSMGCVRRCPFCAVPVLEPEFFYLQSLSSQIEEVKEKFGEKKDLIVLDNNILALKNIVDVLREIERLGFYKGAKFNGRKRYVDFNQGIDIRLVSPQIADILGRLEVKPTRLAFDTIKVKQMYTKGVKLLADYGVKNFMTYIMYNYEDTPQDFYNRISTNIDLQRECNIRISGFPMKFVPIWQTERHYIGKYWNWRYLRGIQCVLNATRGMVSPKETFFNISFGATLEEFLEIISMPDNFIIYRSKHKADAENWKKDFYKFTNIEKEVLFSHFNENHNRKKYTENNKINKFLDYYYC
ncbi:MAG: cobalamin-binding domain-containing protein [Anaerolineaceae bacterium]|nr:cobalamin-binding domain-containing protein [Anaerolineaceae bacterium]